MMLYLITMFSSTVSHELYAQFITCNNKSYIISRLPQKSQTVFFQTFEQWQTLIREVSLSDFTIKKEYIISTSMSHNLAGYCIGNRIMFSGGQYRYIGSSMKHWSGLQYSLVDSISSHDIEQNSKYIHAANCQEKRLKVLNVCEFDGKLSIMQRNNRTFLFARANLGIGIRWIQVTSTRDFKSWRPYKLIHIDGVNPSLSSLYFLHVERWNNTHYVGLCPSVFSSSSGIFAIYSMDLIHWSHPQLLMKQYNHNGRVNYHPVGLIKNKLLVFNKENNFITDIKISEYTIDLCNDCEFSKINIT